MMGKEGYAPATSMSVHDEPLKRDLGWWDVLALSIGSVIGSGIFILPARAAGAMGPAGLVPLLIGAGLAYILALCYAECASRFQGTGGAMLYAREAFGPSAAFGVGWATWLARVASWAALTHAFIKYLRPLFPDLSEHTTVWIIGLVAVLTMINLRGVGFSGKANTALTLLKLIPLFVFVALGLFHIDLERMTPFAPHGYGDLGSTTVLLFYSYVGFEGMVIPAAEAKDPKRQMPRALLMGMGIIIVLYVGIWAVCQGTLPTLAESGSPVGDAAAQFMGPWGSKAVHVGILISVLGINAFMALVTPRALYALGREGMLPRVLGRVAPRGTPDLAILLTSLVVIALALTGTFEQLALVSVVCRIAQYIPTALAVLHLRVRDDLPEPAFRVPFGVVLPTLAIGVCCWLLFSTENEKLLWGAAGLMAGYLLYFLSRNLAGPQAS